MIFLPLMCWISLVLAEPPVGNGYAAARSSHDDHHHDHHGSEQQQSLSQEYGPPSDSFASSRNALSTGYEYNAPNARSSTSTRTQSQFAPATVRVSFNQRFGSASARSSAQDHSSLAAKSLSQDYSSSNSRNAISQEYGPPAARSVSQEYGAPSIVSARTLSNEYGAPNARSSPSEEYGVPSVISARSNQISHSSVSDFHSDPLAARSQFQSNSLSRGFGLSGRSNEGRQEFGAPKPFSKSGFGSRSAQSSRSPSPSYGAPSTRSSDQDYDSVSQTYGIPNARALSQEYGVPSSRASLNTNAIASSFSASSRSSPSSSYLPAGRNGMPSEQYGVPEQRDGSGQGYDYARARALEELQNQEPANYDFSYQIEDYESGSDFGHAESRQAGRAEGSYFVVLPDGTKQTVEYEADEGGFKPRVSLQPAAAAGGGYDDGALARAAGPY